MAARPRFDPKRPLVAALDFTFMGKTYARGDAFGPFDPGVVADRMRARQYESRRVNFGEGTTADDPAADPIQMTGPKGGRYTITAPWLEEPEVVRGKVNAEKRLAELQAEGAPLGFIEGGSDVTVEGGEGGWYEVNAPWLDEPEKVQGRETAEARQQELHAAGEPDSHSGYTLTAGDNGWYAITKDGVDTDTPVALNVQGEEKAREAVATLRSGQMIEGTALPAEWDVKPEGDGGEGGEQDPPSDDDESAGQQGGDTDEEDTVEKEPNERAEELGNQPNNAEQAADEQRAGTEGEGKVPAGSDSEGHAVEKDENENDGAAGTVGP